MIERESPVYLEPVEAKRQELKNRANVLYKNITSVMETYKKLSKEYVEVLKEIECEMIKPRF